MANLEERDGCPQYSIEICPDEYLVSTTCISHANIILCGFAPNELLGRVLSEASKSTKLGNFSYSKRLLKGCRYQTMATKIGLDLMYYLQIYDSSETYANTRYSLLQANPNTKQYAYRAPNSIKSQMTEDEIRIATAENERTQRASKV